MTAAATRSNLLAPLRHTMVLCLILLAIAAAGFINEHYGASGGGQSPGIWLYLPLIAAEWALFAFVRAGLRRGGTSLKSVISQKPWTVLSWSVDVALGVGVFLLWFGADKIWTMLFGAGDQAAVSALLVRHAAEIPVWILLSLSAGFVEELTFRGYLQQQFSVLLRNRWFGVGAQAVLFGVTHGYQGTALMIRITVFGVLFGVVAALRRSLRACMIAHALTDIVGGLFQ